MSNLKEIQREAWQYYKTWMKEKTFCKALNKEVVVSMSGWDHITAGGKKHRRKIKDKISRLSLLKQAKFVITNSARCRSEIREKQHYIVLESNTTKPSKVRVVLKQTNNGKLEFFSVMKT